MRFLRKIFLLILLLPVQFALGQRTVVSGTVFDAGTNETLPYVVVQLEGTTAATVTDMEGNYRLETSDTVKRIKASYIGYKPVTRRVEQGEEQTINLKLKEIVNETEEIVVTGKKGRYKNKGNPAVTLIRNVIQHKDENRQSAYDYYEYEKYEKIQFAISNVTEDFKNKKQFKKFQFVFDNLDTTKLEGKPVLPLYIKETLSDVYYRKSPKAQKEIVKGTKMVSFDGYLDDDGLGQYFGYLYQDYNVYDDDILLFTNRFLSPIATLAPTFYMYHIADTLEVNGVECIKLNFLPRNKSDLLLKGDLYIVKDSTYALLKAEMSVDKEINLNWVKDAHMSQEFQKRDNAYVLVKDEMMADFGFSKNSKRGIFGQRSTSFKNMVVNKPREDKEYKGIGLEVLDDAKQQPDSFWAKSRHEELSDKEKNIYSTVDSVKKMPAFKRTMNIFMIAFQGYKSFGPVEIGPVSTFYSFNPVEGFRLRFGGRTTPEFSKKINFESYVAYGFKDEKFKYYFGTTYSLTKRTIWEFPVKSIKAFYQRDTKIPGQELQFVQEDNFFLSFKRGVNDKWLYNDIVYLEYLSEFRSHFSYAVGFKYWQQVAAGGLHFNKVDYNDRAYDIAYLPTTEASLTLRYAPREIFYQGKQYRVPLITKYPVFTLRMITSIKDLLGTPYDYQHVAFNISKRFYLSQLGYSDVTGEVGKLFGQVPYPLLFIHRANQTYAYQLQSYNLMNFLEFVTDEYQSVNVDHNFNGFFFNKIPLLKRLKWRELIAIKALWGQVSDQNNPDHNSDVYKQPVQADGTPITYSIGDRPYIEGSVGIGNILKFFRVDLIRRFTYLEHPNTVKYGVRVRVKFDF